MNKLKTEEPSWEKGREKCHGTDTDEENPNQLEMQLFCQLLIRFLDVFQCAINRDNNINIYTMHDSNSQKGATW